jgi:hypothetical protein
MPIAMRPGRGERIGCDGIGCGGNAEFIILPAETACRVMFFEAPHASDPSFEPSMILFKSIVQVHICPVTDLRPNDARGAHRRASRLSG